MKFKLTILLALAVLLSQTTEAQNGKAAPSQNTEAAHNKLVYRNVSNQAEYDRAKEEGEVPVFTPLALSDLAKLPHLNINNQQGGSDEHLSSLGNRGGGDACDCYLPIDETFSIAPFNSGLAPEYRNDDGSTAVIDLGFTFCLYGTQYTSCFINNNGNISFDAAQGTYSSEGFPSPNYILVAPFWADVDTRNTASGLVHYKITDHSLIVIWDGVGYYSNMADKVNSFQLIITDGQDPILEGGNNVSFCYGDMQWTTGSASQGVDGFGGIPATVGANKGDGIAFAQFGQFDAPGTFYDGPFNNVDGISWLDNKNFVFNTCQIDNNIAPFAPSTGLCDTLVVCQGGSAYLQFLGPEQDQTVTIEYTVDVPGQIDVLSQPQPGSTNVYITGTDNAVPGVYLVSVTGTDDGIPSLSTTVQYYVQITDDIVPPVVIMGPDSLCTGEDALLYVEDIFDTYLWNSGEADSAMIVYGPGTYTLLVTIGVCQRLQDIEITGLPTPAPVINSNDTELCIGQTTTLSVTEVYETYQWDGDANNNAATFDATVGNHSVVVTNEFGCSGSTNYFINTVSIPVDIVAEDSQVCPGATTQLSTVNNYITYIWDSNNNNNQPTYTSGVGSHSVTVTDADGCTGSDTFTVTSLPVPAPNIIGDAIICENATSSLSITQNFQAYEWDNNAINTGAVFEGNVGTHSVTVTDNNGCTGTDTFVVTAFPNPVLPGDALICGTPTEYAISVNNAPVPAGTWSGSVNDPGTPFFDPGNNISGLVTVSQFGQYELTFTDECGNTDEITLTFLPDPLFTVLDTVICQNDSLPYAASSEYASYFNWSWSDGTNTQVNIVHDDSTYVITASNQCGTYFEDVYIGSQPCEVNIPNIFTPNNDGALLNEFFEITGLEFFPGSSLTVFDRWGKKVFESTNYQGNWNGENCASGVYFYIFGLQRNNGVEMMEGNVTIVR
jgi:gliding motility-associated-like protein